MCELFGVSSARKIEVNDLLKEFFSHSVRHANGWGMAVFYENSVSLEKEPVQAIKSTYLKERLQQKIAVRNMIAHIRLATRGVMEYVNCHPFVLRDNGGRCWTLAHNGTIFDYPPHNHYLHQQEGGTDSERILWFLVDRVNQRQLELGRPLTKEERFGLLDTLVGDMAEGNKLNLLIYDGELLYVHTNYADSLYYSQREDALLFATTPLDRGSWNAHPFTALCAYQDGRRLFQGTNHGREYQDNDQDMHMMFVDYSAL
ncbi:MAG: class II glutamine amidotransferase [Oscillospiraceae bacterium]|nr:class II glutamine amidotransferase [Oscillospiraceae bacterium]